MSGQRATSGENHGPGHMRHSAIQFAVNKIAYPAQTKANWKRGNIDIGAFPEIKFVLPTEDPSTDQKSQACPVKRHAAAPCRWDFQRMRQIIRKVVEQDIPQSAANYHAQDKHQIEVFEMFSKLGIFIIPDLFANEKVAGQKSQDVHKPVPTYMQRPETKYYRVDMGEG